MSEISSTANQPTQTQISPEQMIRISSVHFFTLWVRIPDDSEKSEVFDFLELQLEENSPFPLEQLSWGYWTIGSETLIYAAPAKMVTTEIEKHAETVRWVIPAFLPYVISHTEEDGRYCLIEEEASSSLLIYEKGAYLPHTILSSDSDSDRPTKLYQQAQRYAIDTFRSSEMRALPTLVPSRAPRRTIRFAGKGQDQDGHLHPSTSLLQGDLRGKEFIDRETTRRKLGLYLWNTSLGLAALFVLLFCGQVALWWQQSQTKQLVQTFNENNPAAQIIEEKQTLTRKLQEASSAPLQPFELLNAINKFRPKTIHFTAASFNDSGEMKLDGNALTIEEVNQYFAAIENSAIFNRIDLSNLESRDNRGVRFKLTLER